MKAGEVDEEQVDRLVLDVLSMINRVRADEFVATADEQSIDDPAERALTRRAAIGGTVLLRNETVSGQPVLPFDPASITSIAVIGPNAVTNQCMGGGSASLTPFDHRTLLAALTDRLGPGSPTDAIVTFEPGVRTDRLTPVVRGGQLRQPDGEPGLRLEYINGRTWDGDVVVEDVVAELARAVLRVDPGRRRPQGLRRAHHRGIHPRHRRHAPGRRRVDRSGRRHRRRRRDRASSTIPTPQLPAQPGVLRLRQHRGRRDDRVHGRRAGAARTSCGGRSPSNGFAAIRVGIRSPEPADLMDRAVAAAAAADVAVVMVGTNDEWETEGFDRTTMDLPGRQDELVRRVLRGQPAHRRDRQRRLAGHDGLGDRRRQR